MENNEKGQEARLSFLLTKQELCKQFGYSCMTPLYQKIFTQEVILELGCFKTVQEFKNAKTFTLYQSQVLRSFIEQLRDNQ